jgi:hypothetical protein
MSIETWVVICSLRAYFFYAIHRGERKWAAGLCSLSKNSSQNRHCHSLRAVSNLRHPRSNRPETLFSVVGVVKSRSYFASAFPRFGTIPKRRTPLFDLGFTCSKSAHNTLSGILTVLIFAISGSHEYTHLYSSTGLYWRNVPPAMRSSKISRATFGVLPSVTKHPGP